MSLYGQSEKKDHNVCISLMKDREDPPDGSCLTKAVLVNCVKLGLIVTVHDSVQYEQMDPKQWQATEQPQ